jgi:hypothetical protein
MNEELPIIKNWREQENGMAWTETYEVPLFTDVRATNEVRGECGPYWFLNTVPIRDGPGIVQAAIVLRCHIVTNLSRDYNSLETDTTAYHGGSVFDEVTALTSLVLGARIRAGGHTREFRSDSGDPLGHPCSWTQVPEPVLHIRDRRPVIPAVVGSRDLAELHMLKGITRLSFPQSIALIRAARLYQDALWLSESEPNLSWLMLVSALETAACSWDMEDSGDLERLCDANPVLFALLQKQGDDKFVAQVAAQIAPTLKATKKFIDFGLHFLPPPPEQRPIEFAQIDWSKKSWKKILNIIYNYRSEALHSGVPFPKPMCAAPFFYKESGLPSERGTVGLAAHSGGGSWNAADLPINLNLFAIVVRSALLAWIKAMQGSIHCSGRT